MGHTLTMDLCLAGNLPAVKYLVDGGKADLDKTTRHTKEENGLFGHSDAAEGNLTVMHFAAKSGNSALIKYLASKRVSVNDQTYFGVTPLMYAASMGHLDAVKMLIYLKADVNARMASSLKTSTMPEPGTYDQLLNAYQRAQHNGHEGIVAILKEAGAAP